MAIFNSLLEVREEMEYQELITDEATFRALREQCAALFYTDRRLPERVFRRGFSSYCVFEHAQIMRKEFADVLASLAKKSGDKEVNYMTIEPDPVDYYKKHCGFYGLASFSAETVRDTYIKVMYLDGSVESFRARGGDVGVFWGESMRWAAFCDRKSWEVCLLGLDVPLGESAEKELGCMSPSRLTTYISGLYNDKGDVGWEFAAKLKRNYLSLV